MRKIKMFLLELENDLNDLRIIKPEILYEEIEKVRIKIVDYIEKNYPKLFSMIFN